MPKPSTGGIPAAIRKGFKSFRYAVGDIVFVVGRFLLSIGRPLIRIPVSIGRGAAAFWRSLSVISRRRLVLALGVAAVVLLFVSAVVPRLPCEFPGGDSCPPADDAAELVPIDALAYLHANLDPDSDQYADAAELASKLPVLGGQAVDRALGSLPSPGGAKLDFDHDVRPWFGGEAAIAVLPAAGGGRPQLVDLLEVENADAADLAGEYAQSLAFGPTQTAEYEGVTVTTDQRDVATAEVAGFLAIGTGDAVRSVVATATGADGAESLADDPTAEQVRDELPEQRFAEAWLSADGISELVADGRGALGTLTPLIAPGASTGAAASLSASGDELELAVRSVLDPKLEQASPPFFAAFPDFEPDLAERLLPDTLAYVGIGPASKTVTALLSQASVRAPGIAAGFADLVQRLRHAAGVDLERQLLASLGDQSAVALEPAAGQGSPTTVAPPYLLFAADGVDEDEARNALASLQGPLSEGVDTGEGQAPVFGQDEVSGVETNSLRVSPTVQLTYAVFDGIIAVATDPAGVAAMIADHGGLDDSDLYKRATEDFPDQVSLQAYLNLEGLVATGERAGLAEDPLYATFAGDFRRLDALGLAVSQDDDVLATDARLLVGDPPPADQGTTPLAPPAE